MIGNPLPPRVQAAKGLACSNSLPHPDAGGRMTLRGRENAEIFEATRSARSFGRGEKMKIDERIIQHGYDGARCLVHARCADSGNMMLATAQYLDVTGNDLFSGIYVSLSRDGGRSFSPFAPSGGLAPIIEGGVTTVPCDGTPTFHRKTGRFIILGQTAEYPAGAKSPSGENRRLFYGVYNGKSGEFEKARLIPVPDGYFGFGCGSGQCVELDSGDLLVPVNLARERGGDFLSAVLLCGFDGQELYIKEMGEPLTTKGGRGLYEPSLIEYKGDYYMTMRNDFSAYVAKSSDGLHYSEPCEWTWQDGEPIGSYNTQQHWLRLSDGLYLVYTRRGANNDHIPRHRAPLFVARVEGLRLVKDSERIAVRERGARLGNFSAYSSPDGGGVVMAAEWMQPVGCERYGCDNAIFLTKITSET